MRRKNLRQKPYTGDFIDKLFLTRLFSKCTYEKWKQQYLGYFARTPHPTFHENATTATNHISCSHRKNLLQSCLIASTLRLKCIHFGHESSRKHFLLIYM